MYEPNLERALSTASKGGSHPKAYRNYKQLLADKDVQAVLIATPEHWHHQMVLDALAAGKDVYVEKPLCQTPEQGRELVDAEKKSEEHCAGWHAAAQLRSIPRGAQESSRRAHWATSGWCGRWWLNNGLSSTKAKLDGPLDWEQWQGPARKRAPEPDRFRHWRLYSDYAGGMVADQGRMSTTVFTS